MPLLEKDQFVCIDCESTGLDPKMDQIIEVAVVSFTLSEGVQDSFESLIDPLCVIPESSIEIHHIKQEMVDGQPKIGDVLARVLEIIGRRTIVGHGVKFDIELIALAAEKAGIPCRIRQNPTIDTLRLARLYGDSPSNALATLGLHFNVPSDGSHRAMSDVRVNIEVFKHLSHRFKTTEKLHEALSRPILLKTMPLGPHKGRLMRDVPHQYLQWASNKDFDQDLLFSLRSELKRRKKGNLFEQMGNPFSSLE